MKRTAIRLTLLLALAVAVGTAAAPRALPGRACVPVIDGDPRDAFRHGALELPMTDAVTGRHDGSLRAYAMAVPEGLYVTLLSTEASGTHLALPAPDARGADLLLGEWMAVRVGGEDDPSAARLFVLTADNRAGCLALSGVSAGLTSDAWACMGRRFGYTWAGEWLLPWAVCGAGPGATVRLEILRGRKLVFGGQAIEVLARSSPGAGASRWGGAGLAFLVPKGYPEAQAGLTALAPFDVRPFIPPADQPPACASTVPAGQVATAWLEWRGPARGLRLSVAPAGAKGPRRPVPVEAFRVDFWWQAGIRTEQDALFPARVASGEGDVLAAERLFPQEPRGWSCGGGDDLRLYVRWRVPPGWPAGPCTLAITARDGAGTASTVPWTVTVAPPLPPPSRLYGIYYLTRDERCWPGDLRDIADHGFTAATCPARTQEGWERFKALARKAGLDGAFALDPDALVPVAGDWAYVADEPGTAAALDRAEARAKGLRAKGWKTWAALCWPPLGTLPDLLDAAAYAPNLLEAGAPPNGGRAARWTYIQGLRENPGYDREQMGAGLARAGLSGIWVFCYRPEPEGTSDDWASPPIRYDAVVAPSATVSLQTVEWEACRQGILEGRVLQPAR